MSRLRLRRRIAVNRVDPQHRFRLLDRLDVEVDRERCRADMSASEPCLNPVAGQGITVRSVLRRAQRFRAGQKNPQPPA